MKVKVIDGCISCGLCTEEFPDLFQMNEAGIAQAVSSHVPSEMEDQARQAAEDCPVSVIITEE